MESDQEMALPIGLWWNIGQCDLENSWNLDISGSGQFDSTLSTPWNFETDSQADTFRHFRQPNSSTQGSDNPLSTSRSGQAIEPEDVRNYCFSSAASLSTERQSRTLHSRTSPTKLLKEIVLARAKADPRKISQQEKRRDAFIATRLEQLEDEHAEEARTTSPISSSIAWAGKLQRQAHPQPGYFKSVSNIAQTEALLLNQSATNVEATNACASIQSASSLFPSVSSLGSKFETTELGYNGISANTPTSAQKRVEKSLATVSPTNSASVEMVFNTDMHPASQQPKQARSKEDNAARLAVRRRGGACSKHKSTKKKVRFLGKL
jgi:hypothetical protein